MFKKSKIVASCLAVASLALGVFALNGNVKASAEDSPLSIREGATIRVSTDGLSDGLRFTAIATEAFTESKINVDEMKTGVSYVAKNEYFGMIIVPKFYVTDYEAYKAGGGELDYYAYFKDVKKKMINFAFAAEHITYNATKQAYLYSGAVANVNFNNMIMDYQSIAYYKNADGTYTYSTASDARNYGYVASAAYNSATYNGDEILAEKLEANVEKAMYVASGVVFDYETGLYSYNGASNENVASLVTLAPTIEISGSVTTLKLGETTQLTAVAAPFANVDVVWSVAENSPVTVENGLVTANAAGTAVVTASYMNGKYSDTYEITVAKEAVTLANTKDVETKVDNALAFTGLIDGNVTDVAIGGKALSGWTYDDATDTLSIPAVSLVGVELGQNKALTIETASTVYTQKVWVVNKVIKDFQTLRTLYSTSYVDIDPVTHAISGYYVLGADITCDKRSWNSSGTRGQGLALDYFINDDFFKASQATLDEWSAAGTWAGFVGTFDGRGYAIKNMPAVQGGMFNKIGDGGVVKNLILKNVNLRTGGYLADVATLAQYNYGTISQVIVSVYAMARQAYSSALVMNNYGTINNVHVRVQKSGDWATHFYAIGSNKEGGVVTNAVVSTTFDILDAALVTKANGDGYNVTSKQWYTRFGTAAEGYATDDGTNGRDGFFLAISDNVAQIDAYNASAIDVVG